MLKTAHCPTGSACANVRRVSARFRHFAPLTKAPQRKRELAASGCCFVYSIRRCSVIMSIASRRGTSRTCYQNGNRSFQWFFPAGFTPKHLRLKCGGQHRDGHRRGVNPPPQNMQNNSEFLTRRRGLSGASGSWFASKEDGTNRN